MLNPFTPGQTVSRAVTTSTANVALPALRGNQICVHSPAANQDCFIKFGTDNSVTAAVTDYPILAGTVEVLTVPPGMTYVAAITATGTATLYFTGGDGQ